MQIEKLATYRLIRVLRFVIPVLVIVLAAIPAWNYLSRRAPERPAKPVQALPKDLAVLTEGFTLSRTEGGRTLFSIKAKTQLGFTDNKYSLEDVEVTLHGVAGNDAVHRILSKTCSYDEAGGDIVFSGGVVAHLDEKTVGRTEELVYNHSTRVIASSHPTFVEQTDVFNGEAGRLEYLIDKSVLKVDGNVKIRMNDGVSLESGWAMFNRNESRVMTGDGIYVTSSGGWIRGTTGYAELEPQRFKPKRIVVEGAVTASSPTFNLRSGLMIAVLNSAGRPQTLHAAKDVELHKGQSDARQTLLAEEVDAALDAEGNVESLEARNNARMILGGGRTLTAPKIRTEVSSTNTEGPSVLQVAESRIEGRDFKIQEGELIRFDTTNRAELISGGRRSTANRTEARFDRRTNQLVELVQTGAFEVREGNQQASANSARIEESGNVVSLDGDASFSDAEKRVTAERIRLNKNANTFSAVRKVKTIIKNAAEPVLIRADQADGAADRIVYSRQVEFWKGQAYIKADRLEASTRDGMRSGVATGNVSSNFESVRAFSGRLEYNDAQRTLHYMHNVRVQKQEMSMNADDVTVKFDNDGAVYDRPRAGRKEVSEIIARGSVTVTRAGQRGRGDQAVYAASTGQVTITGKPATATDDERGAVEGARIVMQTSGDRITVEGGAEGRASARQVIKKK